MITADKFATNVLGMKVGTATADVVSSAALRTFDYVTARVETIAQAHRLGAMGFEAITPEIAMAVCEPIHRDPPEGVTIRAVAKEDAGAVANLSMDRTFSTSRLHLDPIISNRLADLFYAEWAKNCALGIRGDGGLVAERDDAVIGFMFWTGDTLDLMAAPNERGVGGALVSRAVEVLNERGHEIVRGFTTAYNVQAMTMYTRLGWKLESVPSIVTRWSKS